jgi:pimeloyl-ACP methyl ester carboxylesterase
MRKVRPTRFLVLAAVIVGSAGAVPASPAGEQAPIVGRWKLEGGVVQVKPAEGDDHFTGVVIEPTRFSTCDHPKGQVMWDIFGSGTHYSGTHIGWTAGACDPLPGFQATWDVAQGADDVEDLLTFCATPPEGSSPQCSTLKRFVPKQAIVFIHGFLGSEIACGDDMLWPDKPPEFNYMLLAANGVDNSRGNDCNAAARPTGKIIKSFAGTKVYGPTIDFLESLPRKHYLFAYDWRKSPERALDGLNALVNKARSESGERKVVLMAHSMGGLVARWYVDRHPEKVARAVSIGTPYWGAPTPWLALSHGWTTAQPGVGLDAIIPNGDMKEFARHLTGGYFLYPSRPYFQSRGGWLSWPEISEGPLDERGTKKAIRRLFGASDLYAEALDQHAAHLDYHPSGVDPDNGVDYHFVVGTGIQTVSSISEQQDIGEDPTYEFESGDGTVPAVSASAGLSEALSSPFVHYVCGVGHVDLPGDPAVTSIIKGFLLKGTAIPTGSFCP